MARPSVMDDRLIDVAAYYNLTVEEFKDFLFVRRGKEMSEKEIKNWVKREKGKNFSAYKKQLGQKIKLKLAKKKAEILSEYCSTEWREKK